MNKKEIIARNKALSHFLRILRSDFFKNSAILFFGTTGGQIIVFLGSLILTRLYFPEEFGIYAQFSAMVGFIAIVSTLRLDAAVVLAGNEHDEDRIIHLLILGVPIISVMMSFLVFSFLSLSKISFIDGIDLYWCFLIIIGSILQASQQILSFKLTREKRFFCLSVARFAQPFLFLFAALAFVYIYNIRNGLIYSILFSQLCMITYQIKGSRRLRISIKLMFSLDEIKSTLRKFSNFPKYYFPHSFLDSLQLNTIIFMIGHFFSLGDLGQYSLANRVLKTPVNIIGSVVSQVFLQRISEKKERDELIKLSSILVLFLSGVAALIIVIGTFTLSFLFDVMFDERWRSGSRIAIALLPLITANFVVSPLSQIPLVLGKQKAGFLIGLLYGLIYLGSFALCNSLGYSFEKTITYTSIVAAGVLGLYALWIFRCVLEE